MRKKSVYRLSLSVYAITIALSFLFSSNAFSQIPFSAQPKKNDIRNGNKAYAKANYADAEIIYRKALDKDADMTEAHFNLGDVFYQQKKYEESLGKFRVVAYGGADKNTKAKAFHNIGNIYLQQGKWTEAQKAFKDALKNNPRDMDTKYNLAYANARAEKPQKENSLELQAKLLASSGKLKDLAKKQQDLARKAKANKNGSNKKLQEEIKEEQRKLTEELKRAQKELADLKKQTGKKTSLAEKKLERD